MPGIRYEDHPCSKCSQPSYGLVRTKAWLAFLCYLHYFAETNAYLLTHPLTKPSSEAYK